MGNLNALTSYPQGAASLVTNMQAALTADEAAFLSLTPGTTTVIPPGAAVPLNNGILAGALDQVMVGGRLLFNQLAAPAAPTLTTNGTAGATTYDYAIEAVLGTGNTGAGAATAITTGNATLSATNSINIVFLPIAGATKYNIRRTVGGATQGIIGSVVSTGAASYTFVDTGLTGDASTAPVINTTGVVYLPTQELITAYAANGAISSPGKAVLTKAGVAVMTIVAPIAGAASAGGHDGLVIQVIDTGGHAHTVTGPSNCFNGSTHIATFGGTVGQNFTMIAYNGVWYVTGNSGVTLS